MDTNFQVDNKKDTPLVSVLMLTYNGGRFIKEAIESVLTQTYVHLELIIIDDGSTDDTQEIIRRFTDERIRYISHEKNAGLLARRKESPPLAKGACVAVLDSDDVWLPTKLEKQVAYFSSHRDCVLIGTWIKRINEQGKSLGITKYNEDDLSIRASILMRNQFAHSSVLMRKDALDKTEGYRFPLDEDLDLFLQLGAQGTFANIAEVLTEYRINAMGQSRNKIGMIENVLAIIHLHRKNYAGYCLARLKYLAAYVATYIKNALGSSTARSSKY
jgi:glycosyltransferase involved in cell wall biosynthesis